jgi:hypothetical protein
VDNNTQLLPQEELTEIQKLLETANQVMINDQASLNSSSIILHKTKEKIKRVDGIRKSLLDPLKLSVKNIDAWFKDPLGYLEKARMILSDKTNAYLNKIEAERQEKERQLRIEHEKAERIRKAEAEEKAQKALDKGADETAMQYMRSADYDAPAPVAFASIAKPVELKQRLIWCHEVTDLKLLCKAISEGKADINCIQPNPVFLNMYARGTQGGTPLAGVKFYQINTKL